MEGLVGNNKNGRSRCGRTIQRDRVCRGGVRVPQARQKRVRERNAETQRGSGETGAGKRSAVPENRREEEQGRAVAPGSRGREQGFLRHERGAQKVTACERRPGQPRAQRGAGNRGLLRAFRRDENVHERRHRRRGIGLGISGDEVVILSGDESIFIILQNYENFIALYDVFCDQEPRGNRPAQRWQHAVIFSRNCRCQRFWRAFFVFVSPRLGYQRFLREP